MKKWHNQQQVLVWRNGKLCWRIRPVYYEPIKKPWYKFWQISDVEVTYGDSKYIEVPEDTL